MQQVDGARQIDVDLDKQAVTVVFDPATVDEHALRAAVTRAGYTPKTGTVVSG
jgi:copper chaperone CopZ